MTAHDWPNDQEKAHLRNSFGRLIFQSDVAVERFYATIFERAPAVRSLFPEDLSGLKEKFMLMLAWFLDHADKPEEALAEARRLGRRHREYGALDAHYPVVGQALIEALIETCEPPLTEEEQSAWSRFYGIIATAMTA